MGCFQCNIVFTLLIVADMHVLLDFKGFKNDGKGTPGGSSNSGMSGRSGRGSMSSMAEKAAVLQGKRNQRGSRRKDGITAASK